MNISTTTALWATIALLVLAVYWDIRWRRIPNWLILIGWGAALAWQLLAPSGKHFLHPSMPGAQGLIAAMGATGLMLLMTFVCWNRGFFGAGDAKLLSVLAAFSGPLLALPLLILTLLSGGLCALLALTQASQRERLLDLLCGFPAHQTTTRPLPYAVAIASGTLCLYGLIANQNLPAWLM